MKPKVGLGTRLLCEHIADIIASAERHKSLDVYSANAPRRAYVDMSKETRNLLLESMAIAHCRHVEFGSYDCYDETNYGFSVDYCLVDEVDKLVCSGIKTIGCCCGHGKKRGYIQVSPDSIDAMRELGYEQMSLDVNGFGEWCFCPKTPLPDWRSI